MEMPRHPRLATSRFGVYGSAKREVDGVILACIRTRFEGAVGSREAWHGEFSVRPSDVEVLEYIKALISSHRS